MADQKKLLNDCFLHDKDRMRHDDALALIKSRLKTIVDTETVKLKDATGRILAEDIKSKLNIPPSDNSAVDGYAYNAKCYDATGGFFPIATRIAAGDNQEIELPENTAARIFTGAPMPTGANTIAMQEDCETHEQDQIKMVVIPPGLKEGANRRRMSEDVSKGETIASKGQCLSPALLAAIASSGNPNVKTYKKLKIGLMSSGNELLDLDASYEAGKIYDSNGTMLKSLLSQLSFDVADLGIIKDNREATKKALKEASKNYDIIIASGGASRGEEDHMIASLHELGKCNLWQLAVKPGRPMSMGQIDDNLFFGLPGNPVACFVCYLLYVRQALMLLGGGLWQEPERYLVPAGFEIAKKKTDRREFLRGRITITENSPLLEKFERDGSGLITGLRQSSGLIELHEEINSVEKGQMLPFIPFSQFGIL